MGLDFVRRLFSDEGWNNGDRMGVVLVYISGHLAAVECWTSPNMFCQWSFFVVAVALPFTVRHPGRSHRHHLYLFTVVCHVSDSLGTGPRAWFTIHLASRRVKEGRFRRDAT